MCSQAVSGTFASREGFDLALSVKRQKGFSLTELIVALIVAVILMAVSLPMFLRAYHSYQLTNAANQMAGILRAARYEAIGLNKSVNCVIAPYPTDPTMTLASMTDTSGNPLTGMGAMTLVLGSSGNLVASGSVPGTSALPTVANLSGTVPVSIPPGGATIQFDARGAVKPTNVNVFYLASSAAPDAGYRAILLMPAGSIQIWTTDSSGNWQELR